MSVKWTSRENPWCYFRSAKVRFVVSNFFPSAVAAWFGEVRWTLASSDVGVVRSGMGSLSGGGTSHASSYSSCFFFLFTRCLSTSYLGIAFICLFHTSHPHPTVFLSLLPGHAFSRLANLFAFYFHVLLTLFPQFWTPTDYNLFASNTAVLLAAFFYCSHSFLLHALPGVFF